VNLLLQMSPTERSNNMDTELATRRKRNPSVEDLNDPLKQAGYLSRFHDNPLRVNERLALPLLPEIFRIVPYPNYNAAIGLMDDAAKLHLMLRIIGDPGSGKTRLLLEYKKKSEIEAHYVAVPKHSSDKDLLLMISSSIGYYPYADTSSLQVELIAHINDQARPVVFLIDEVDNMCPKTRQKNASNIDKLDVLRFIWDYTRKYASFILAAPYDLEAKIQKSDENITNSQLYRRCPAHMLTGMPDEQARILLSSVEEDFNIILDEVVKNKLLQRIHQIKRGGLGVAIDILFRVLLVMVPDMKDFYQALVSDVDRNDALKLISHKNPIRISEDVLLGAMSMQR